LSKTINVALVGTGFGQRVMLPAFAACEGARLAAVCSATQENAERAAEAFQIPGVYTDYEAMLEAEALDLVLITTPPYLHLPMVQAACERGLNVLCEKPTAMDLAQARTMLGVAQRAGTLCLIDHELRFVPTLQKLKALVDEGYLGPPKSVSFSIQWCYPLVLERPWNWWFDREKGGGLLGALGSHQIDLLRWLFDTEFKRVNGTLRSFVEQRPDAQTGAMRPVTTDNFCAWTAELDNGAVGTVCLDASARVLDDGDRWTLGFHGQEGSLLYDGKGRLWAINGKEKVEHTQADPATPGMPEGVFPQGFAQFSKRIVSSLQAGEPVAGAATFHDGLKVQAVLDAVRASHERGTWEAPQA